MAEYLIAPDPECTFKPAIKISRENSTPNKFVERVNGWKKTINEKISQEKDNRLEEDLKKCTFSPNISPARIKPQKNANIPVKKERVGYAKKYQQVTADEFLHAVKALHNKLHQDI